MAVRAREFLPRVVVRVAERVAVGASVDARGPVSLLIVANSARSHLTPRIRFGGGRVARVAIVVCCKIGRDRQTRTAIHRRTVATCATSLRARRTGVVLCVVEFNVEGLIEAGRKTLQWRIVAADVRVTDDAHRYGRRGELTAMTVGASLMTRKAWRCRVVSSFVTRVTGEGTVSLAVVQEF